MLAGMEEDLHAKLIVIRKQTCNSLSFVATPWSLTAATTSSCGCLYPTNMDAMRQKILWPDGSNVQLFFLFWLCMHACLPAKMSFLEKQNSNRAVLQTIHTESLDSHYEPVNWLIYNPYNTGADKMARITPGNLSFSKWLIPPPQMMLWWSFGRRRSSLICGSALRATPA